ncbi:hypothetical protein HYS47_01960 [Candidatus Woesearchaeota archaeon]|nr:hypothetical protein [Candidatus Woesearchaeota archaeon]
MGQTDWLGFESKEALEDHLRERAVQHTADISQEDAKGQYRKLVFKPNRIYYLKSDLVHNPDGTIVDRLTLQRIPVDHADPEQETTPLGDITVMFSDDGKDSGTYSHNGRPRPRADPQQVQTVYETLARRVVMIERNTEGGLMLTNTEHLNGMYDLEGIGLERLPEPYCTPNPRSVEGVLQQRVGDEGKQHHFPNI